MSEGALEQWLEKRIEHMRKLESRCLILSMKQEYLERQAAYQDCLNELLARQALSQGDVVCEGDVIEISGNLVTVEIANKPFIDALIFEDAQLANGGSCPRVTIRRPK